MADIIWRYWRTAWANCCQALIFLVMFPRLSVMQVCILTMLHGSMLAIEISTYIGSRVFDDIETAKTNIGKADVRFTNGRHLITFLKVFHQEAGTFDQDLNGNKCKDTITMLIKTIHRLEKLLEKG